MTKTKAEHKLPFSAQLPKSQRRQDMFSGDGSSNTHSRQTHRHPLHVTSQQSLDSTQKIMNEVSSQTKHKDTNSKPACKRGSTSTTAIRHTVSGGKEVKPEKGKRTESARSTPNSQKSRSKLSVPRKLSDVNISTELSSTNSSSETSDCTSEENKIYVSQSIDITETSNGGIDEERKKDSREKLPDYTDKYNFASSLDNTIVTPEIGFEVRSISSPGDERSLGSFDTHLNMSASVTLSDFTGDTIDGMHKELLREIDELRSENEYLKDEVEELRSEMLEMRDMYMEEDVYQLQELRQQLDQANKTCRILQYRLRKAERRSLRVAQTGQVDGELIRTLEHDIRVAKSVSVRLHHELEVVQKKSTRLDRENEGLREHLQDLEVTKQVLQAELDKSRESSLRRKSLRSTSSKSEKKLSSPDDSADLKCQLHFAKEESALMCKKLTKTALECESMREELARYRQLYGDVDVSQTSAGTTNSGHTREAEVKVHLRLVEEEAMLLSRRIVELEVENRGLRAEMSELQERAGGSQEDDLMEAAGECLSVSLCMEEGEQVKGGANGEHRNLEERTGCHEEGVGPWLDQNLGEGQIGGETATLEGHMRSAESPECGGKVPCEEKCNLSPKDQVVLTAIHDQVILVRSTVEFLLAPTKKGLAPTFIYGTSYTQCKSLTFGLEVLHEQLCALVAKVETLVKSALTDNESKNTSSDKVGDTNIEPVLQIDKQVTQQCPVEDVIHVSSHTWEPKCSEDSLAQITMQLRCFLQQWRQGKRPAEPKSLFEMDFKNDLFCQMEAELHRSKKTCGTHEKCHTKVCSVLLSNLRAALQDLGDELQEEYLASQHIAQQFAQAKAAWAVECTELKCLIGRLENTPESIGAKGSLDLKKALPKDHIERLQQRLAESYAAVMKVSQQLKVCERNWKCERQEFVKYLSQACQDWHRSSNTKESSRIRSLQLRGETTRNFFLHRVDPKAQSTQIPNKNWLYLTQEAALVDKEGPWKTWDCPIMSPSFPGLSLKNEMVQKSHTAPERTSLRIYYSPPSARRIHRYAVKMDADAFEKSVVKQELCCSRCSHEHISLNSRFDYDGWQGTLPFEYEHSTVIRSNSPSAFQQIDSSFSSCLPFSGVAVSANLSDDMKEITANVLQPSNPKRRRSSVSRIVEVVTTGTQTHALAQVNSVALQTEGPQNVNEGIHWSPRITSFMSGHHQQIPPCLERTSGLAEQVQPSTSPKIQRRHSASYLPPPTSLTSNSSNSSTSLTSSSLSSYTSLTNSSRQEVPKHHGLWPKCSSGSSSWARSSSTRSSSVMSGGNKKAAGRKNASIHKYGLVQEFFRSVCGRGEKPKPGEEKAPVVRRDHIGQAKLKKTEGPPSRIPTVQLVRSDSVTKIVNRRFIKQGQKDEQGPGQSQSQSQYQCQCNKTPLSNDKSHGPVSLESVPLKDRSCDCKSRTLSSCFARASRTNLHHARGHCKLSLH